MWPLMHPFRPICYDPDPTLGSLDEAHAKDVLLVELLKVIATI